MHRRDLLDALGKQPTEPDLSMGTVELCVRLFDPGLDPSLPMWGDVGGGWLSPAMQWLSTLVAAGVPFRAGADPAADDDAGLLIVPDPDHYHPPIRTGRPVLYGAPPDEVPERLRLISDALGALVVPDLRGVLVLRLDDPGASQKRHLRGWAHPDVHPVTWQALWDDLRSLGARASVFCCPGWVTEDGRVSDSRLESPGEWEALDAGRRQGLVDLECHGFTHMDPDLDAWRQAYDRGDSEGWYRELWPPRHPSEPSVEEQGTILARWKQACGPGTTVVAPGEAWGLNSLAASKQQGFLLFNSWGLCRLDLAVPTWTADIGSPYLDRVDPSWPEREVPTIAYWHDRDMALNGPTWFAENMDAWRDCGMSRFWAFADLARALTDPVDAALVAGEVVIRHSPATPLRIERAR